MKNKLPFFFLFICITLFQGCSLPTDDESEEGFGGTTDDFTSQLLWEGETDKFTISTKTGLRLNAPQESAGSAYITTPTSTIKSTRWEFGVRLTFNPSANNYARFYLASSSKVLSGSLNGYFLQIGGSKDNVALYRQEEKQPILLASGRELMKGENSPNLLIKVECDNNGYWTFWTRLESESEYTKEKQIKDVPLQNSICSGIYCVYTKTRSKGFTFHHIQQSNDVETITSPDEPSHLPDVPDTPELPVYPEEVEKLLLFNEVMYDNATNGAEYIELYNPNATTVSVPALKLLRYVTTSNNLTETKIDVILKHPDSNRGINVPAYGYLCLTKHADLLVQKHHISEENLLELSNFPRLANEDSHLAIMTDEEKPRMIDKCSYLETMHSTDDKRHQGISLEKISPEVSSSTPKNWRSSKDKTGGTPGMKNSQE